LNHGRSEESKENTMATQPIPRVTEEPLATVHQYIDAFNKGDVEAMDEAFAAPGVILYGLAPHIWEGPRASRDWYRDALAVTQEQGATDFHVELGEPLHVEVTGNSGYIAVPATMTFGVHGRRMTQSDAVMTIVLRRQAEGWRIRAWAWAKSAPGQDRENTRTP
jgi:ketosteroid isomerase-like protein